MILAEGAPVTHPTVSVCSGPAFPCALSYDSVVSSALAILVTLVIGFWIASRLRPGVPSKFQMVFEWLISYIQGLVRETVSPDAMFILPLAVTIFLYILVANWMDILPLPKPLLHPANTDLNQTAAMAVVVIVVVQWYSIKVLGFGGYLRRFTKPFDLPWWARALYLPLNIIEEVVKPVTLSLRLFGNIFAGAVMVYLLTLLPALLAPAPLVVWKFFDVFFVGTIQAFIFMLLTIIYFEMAREGLEHEVHSQTR